MANDPSANPELAALLEQLPPAHAIRSKNGSIVIDGATWVGEEGDVFGQLSDAADHLAVAMLLAQEQRERQHDAIAQMYTDEERA